LKFEDILDEETAKLFHVRLLDRINTSELDCTLTKSFTTCEYIHIASNYYSLSDYERSAEFFERALKHKNYSMCKSVKYLNNLYISYSKLNNISKLKEVKGKFQNLSTIFLNQPSLQVYLYLNCYYLYRSLLETYGEYEKSIAIHEKIIDSLDELGKSEQYSNDVFKLTKMTMYLLEIKEYNRVVKFANRALMYVTPEGSVHEYEYIVFSLWKGQALFSIGNLTDAIQCFQDLMRFLTEKNLTISYSQDYNKVCHYLFKIGNFDYFIECYFDDIIENLKNVIYGAIYMVLGVPYDPVSKINSPPIVILDSPIEKYPRIIKLSKKSSLRVGRTKDMTSRRKGPRVLISTAPTDYLNQLKSAYNMLINCNLVRFFINFLSIFTRLWCVYFMYFIVMFSITKSFYLAYNIYDFFYFLYFYIIIPCFV